MISELGLSVSMASSLLAVSDAPVTRLIPSMEEKVTELLDMAFTQLRNRERRPLVTHLYNCLCQRFGRLDLINISGLRRLCLTPQRVAPDPVPVTVVKVPDVDEDDGSIEADDDNYSDRDNITNTLGRQLSKSINRAIAKMVKQEHNRVAKRLVPSE